jgi:hypothetical protein
VQFSPEVEKEACCEENGQVQEADNLESLTY